MSKESNYTTKLAKSLEARAEGMRQEAERFEKMAAEKEQEVLSTRQAIEDRGPKTQVYTPPCEVCGYNLLDKCRGKIQGVSGSNHGHGGSYRVCPNWKERQAYEGVPQLPELKPGEADMPSLSDDRFGTDVPHELD